MHANLPMRPSVPVGIILLPFGDHAAFGERGGNASGTRSFNHGFGQAGESALESCHAYIIWGHWSWFAYNGSTTVKGVKGKRNSIMLVS